jgi:RNA polymerase sigma factor (TIGR02999 family)
MSAPHGEVTALLRRSAAGDAQARDALWSLAHDELRALARARLSREQGTQTWQPTELVHEAFLKLCDLRMPLADRAHFLAMAATAMRQVLIDHARGKRRDKRGGGAAMVTLHSQLASDAEAADIDILDLDRALSELAALDERKARAIEWSYFGGMTDAELALALEVSEATVKRDLRSARAWLATALGGAA